MSVESILQAMAENSGRAKLQRGALLGNAVANVSTLPGQIINDRDQQRIVEAQQQRQRAADARLGRQDARQATEDQRADAALALEAKNKSDLNEVIGAGINPDGTLDIERSVAKAQELQRPDLVPVIGEVHKKLAPQFTQTDPNKDTRDSSGNIVTPGKRTAKTRAELAADAADPTSPTQAQSAAALKLDKPDVVKPAGAGVVHDTENGLVRIGDDNSVTPLGVKGYHPPPAAGGMGSLYSDIDPKAIAAQIRLAKHPPDIAQYGRPAAAAIASELAKKGPNGEAPFDLSSAQREWKAQLRLNSTMNGPQQVRLDESIRSGLAMYDKVDAIAEQWDGMGLGPLSRANLKLAQEGGKGQAAQSIANQLSGQIGQLTSDIATIEQGGLTPTNEARAVAEKSMQDWWGKGTIKDMTAQGRSNMQIRHAARNTQEPMVPGNGVDTRPAVAAAPFAPAAAGPAEGTVKPIPGFAGMEQTFKNGKWVRTK